MDIASDLSELPKRKKRVFSEEHKRRLSVSHSGVNNPSYGKHPSEETRKKLSDANKGKKRTKESREKISTATKKYFRDHPEAIEKISAARKGKPSCNKGKHLSYETKRKISVARTGKYAGINHPLYGKKHSKESIKKMSVAHSGLNNPLYGKHLPNETKRKISDANKGKKRTKESREKISASKKGVNHPCYGKHLPEEHKKNISKSHIGEKNPAWIGGTSFLPYCHKFNDSLKERIRNRDNRTCQLCGKKENGVKHSVHHIHYDKENCYPDLITLCRGCNGRVNTNRDYYENLFMNKLNDRGLSHWTRKCELGEDVEMYTDIVTSKYFTLKNGRVIMEV